MNMGRLSLLGRLHLITVFAIQTPMTPTLAATTTILKLDRRGTYHPGTTVLKREAPERSLLLCALHTVDQKHQLLDIRIYAADFLIVKERLHSCKKLYSLRNYECSISKKGCLLQRS
jgi:hypothetical protein